MELSVVDVLWGDLRGESFAVVGVGCRGTLVRWIERRWESRPVTLRVRGVVVVDQGRFVERLGVRGAPVVGGV